MKRRDFLKRFGIGAAAAVAAPSLVKAALPEPSDDNIFLTEEQGVGVWEQLNEENIRPHHAQYPMTYGECYIDNITEHLERERMRKHWPELVRRYGGKMSITDFIKLSP